MALGTDFIAASVTFAKEQDERYIVTAKSDAQFDALRQDATNSGAKIVWENRDIKMLVVSATSSAKAKLATSQNTGGVAKDQIRTLVQPNNSQDLLNHTFSKDKVQERIDLGYGGSQSKKVVRFRL
jgi:hypothetical protein